MAEEQIQTEGATLDEPTTGGGQPAELTTTPKLATQGELFELAVELGIDRARIMDLESRTADLRWMMPLCYVLGFMLITSVAKRLCGCPDCRGE